MISIVAKFIVNPGEESNFSILINKLIKASLEEAGCIEYALYKNKKKPDTFCLIEKWQDSEAVDIHNNTPHFTTLVPKLIKIANVTVDVYEQV